MKYKLKTEKQLDTRTAHEIYWIFRDLEEMEDIGDTQSDKYNEKLEYAKTLCEQNGAELHQDIGGCYYYEIL